MIKPIQLILLLNLLGMSFNLSGSTSTEIRERHVTAQLLSSAEVIEPSVPFTVGLKLTHDTGWHTYWKSTATGYATSMEWSLPEGFEAGEIQWPAPKFYNFDDYVEYVYDNEVILLVTITPPKVLPEEEVTLKVFAEWLMCEKTCVPGEANLSLSLKTGSALEPAEEDVLSQIERSQKNLPTDLPGNLQLHSWAEGRSIFLALPDSVKTESIRFFDANQVIDPKEIFELQLVGEKATVVLPLNPAEDSIPEFIEGTISMVLNDGNEVTADIKVPIGGAPETFNTSNQTPANSLLRLIPLAFIGGLILNLMPCVFPVLGIKVMGFVNQAGEDRRKVVFHGLTFTAGVLLSFWSLALLLIVLRSGGQELGWGFQLQSPIFVFLLMVFLFLFALNMSGLFEFGQSAVGVGSGLTAKSGLSGSFFSGVLATVVATPCAAPFLAPALGAALALPPLYSFILFTAIGIGLAGPYLLLSAFPAAIKMLPKPGAWMETFKQGMSFLLYATAGYLLWVLAGQLTEEAGYPFNATLLVLLALVAIAAAAWIYGRWGAFHQTKRARVLASIFALGLTASALAIAWPRQSTIVWQKWEPALAQELANKGKTVYVDFTARWCVTCQTNKAAVFSSSEAKRFIAQEDVVLLKADWTNRDDRITKALAKFNRSAVPFNLVYGPELENPIELPEILTPGIVLEAFSAANP